MVQDKTDMKGRSEMIRYDDTRKDLPNEALFALFLSVGWANEDGAKAHLHHFNVPFCGSSFVISAWDGEVLVGCARVLSDGAVRSVLYDLAVLPAYQKQGIGGTLLARCMERYPMTEWILETTPACVAFYEKHGLSVTAVGEDGVFMRCPCPLFG